jgi:hypothetical protein
MEVARGYISTARPTGCAAWIDLPKSAYASYWKICGERRRSRRVNGDRIYIADEWAMSDFCGVHRGIGCWSIQVARLLAIMQAKDDNASSGVSPKMKREMSLRLLISVSLDSMTLTNSEEFVGSSRM